MKYVPYVQIELWPYSCKYVYMLLDKCIFAIRHAVIASCVVYDAKAIYTVLGEKEHLYFQE